MTTKARLAFVCDADRVVRSHHEIAADGTLEPPIVTADGDMVFIGAADGSPHAYEMMPVAGGSTMERVVYRT